MQVANGNDRGAAQSFVEVHGAAARLALALESPLREQLIARHKAMLMATLEAHKT